MGVDCRLSINKKRLDQIRINEMEHIKRLFTGVFALGAFMLAQNVFPVISYGIVLFVLAYYSGFVIRLWGKDK